MKTSAWIPVVALSVCFLFPTGVLAGKSGIWKPADGSCSFYIQTYDTGSCIIIATRDGETFYVFLEPECGEALTTDEYFGKSAAIQLVYTGSDTAVADLKIGQEVTKYQIEKLFEADCRNGGGSDGTFTNSLGMNFVYLSPGSFTMGSPESEQDRYGDEVQHQVTLTQGFYLQTTEVTQAQWKAVMGSNPSHFDQCGDNCPVEEVSWDDVQAFIAQLNTLGEGTYRLPTEAEWEYAARAGSAMAFDDGDISGRECDQDPYLAPVAWYCYNSGGKPHTVAGKAPNRWGLYDMHGNVMEWCQDTYGSYTTSAAEDYAGPEAIIYMVYRGGSWLDEVVNCRSAARFYSSPSNREPTLGVRLALDYP